VEETAAALEEITTTVRDAAKRTEESSQLVALTRLGAEKSGEIVLKAVSAMQQIDKSSGEISNIIGVIDGGRLLFRPLGKLVCGRADF
ncbi:hypothetical protein ACCS64_38460, partial [Rhizobium ruizarguesonis]